MGAFSFQFESSQSPKMGTLGLNLLRGGGGGGGGGGYKAEDCEGDF